MVRTNIWKLLLIGHCFFLDYAASKAQWNILNYIEGDNNIGNYAWHNINEMKKIGSTNKINLMVQLDEPKNKKTWRLHVVKKKLVDAGSLDVDMGKNPEKELKEATLWAHTCCPSDYTMIILWNHGNGILDEPKNHELRGILYDYTNHTFMNNQQLTHALSYITKTVLGKKIEILGMDACLMSMVEVAYQVKQHAQLLIASESLELAPGWDYAHFLNSLNKTQERLTPRTVALHVVSSFARLNRSRTSHYTLSVVELSTITALKNALNSFVAATYECQKINPAHTVSLIQQARDHSIEFEKGKYIDLYSFLDHLKRSIKRSAQTKNALFMSLTKTVENCLLQLSKSVIISRIGPALSGTGGLSIYFPRQPIHHSYEKTKFAQDTQWLSFINFYHPQKQHLSHH